MALQKVTYIDLVTIIGAENLNDIQDAIIDLEEWQEEVVEEIPQILANIAPEFSNSVSYSAGDCVIVLNKLYQFTADHPAGDWTGADAAEVNVTSLLKEAADSLSGDIDSVKAQALTAFATDMASGAIASFPDGANVIPVKDLSVSIEPVQSGSGDPSPDNIRPISGWTGAEVTRTGVNVWDEEWETGTISSTNGANSPEVTRIRTKNKIPVIPGSTYYDAGGRIQLFYYGASEDYIGFENNFIGPDVSITIPDNVYFIRFVGSQAYGPTYNNDISINYPSTDHDYHAYSGDTYSITFPTEAGTVYGGTLDVTTGKLTVDRAGVDLGTLTWEYRYTGSTNKTILSHLPSMLPHRPQRIVLAENYQYFGIVGATTQLSDPDNLAVGLRTYYVAAFAEYDNLIYAVLPISDSPAGKVVYPLATPIVYDLTPTEVRTLLGQNNIWVDCGNSTVEYRADTKLYIDKKIAALAAAMN